MHQMAFCKEKRRCYIINVRLNRLTDNVLFEGNYSHAAISYSTYMGVDSPRGRKWLDGAFSADVLVI